MWRLWVGGGNTGVVFFMEVFVLAGKGFGTAGFVCQGAAFAGAVFLRKEALETLQRGF